MDNANTIAVVESFLPSTHVSDHTNYLHEDLSVKKRNMLHKLSKYKNQQSIDEKM